VTRISPFRRACPPRLSRASLRHRRLCAILYTYEYNDVFSSRGALDQEPP
jgi:hypothetical protein